MDNDIDYIIRLYEIQYFFNNSEIASHISKVNDLWYLNYVKC